MDPSPGGSPGPAGSTLLRVHRRSLLGSAVCLQLDHFELQSLGNLSRDVQFYFFLIPFHVTWEAKQEEKILFCSLEVIEAVYTSCNLWEETAGMLCHAMLGLNYLKTSSAVSTVSSSLW